MNENIKKDNKEISRLWQDILSSDEQSIRKKHSKVTKLKRNPLEIMHSISPNMLISPNTSYYFQWDSKKSVQITCREFQTLSLIVDGLTVPQAAKHMLLSNRTVEFYVKSLREKFNCSNKRELISLVLRKHLLEKFIKKINYIQKVAKTNK